MRYITVLVQCNLCHGNVGTKEIPQRRVYGYRALGKLLLGLTEPHRRMHIENGDITFNSTLGFSVVRIEHNYIERCPKKEGKLGSFCINSKREIVKYGSSWSADYYSGRPEVR